jgi:LuxR family transcriptional regulator, maltose regulon positive regulatory protein
VLVVAAAGFGKTTLLSQWADLDARPFAWVTLDQADNDPTRLVASIAHGLDRVEPVDHDEQMRPAVLVLDDVHVLHEDGLLEGIAALLDHLPPGSQLVLASRTEPALPIGRLRAQRKVLEVRSADLAMTRSEGAALLRMVGLELDSAQVATLVGRTEGWPVGLYLAALALRDQPDVAQGLARFDGEDRLVVDYLRDELLSQVPDDQLEFLTRTSVLERLSGPLCDFVLEREDSAKTLAEMAHSNLLLVPLDRTGEAYRYHALLASALGRELRRLEPDLEHELHRRASAWYTDHDDPDRAIGHAIASRDLELIGDLLWDNVPRYVPRGRTDSIQSWLAHFTDNDLASVPALALVAATAHLTSGDGNQLRHWASATARGLDDSAPGETPSTLEAGLAVMRAAIGDDGMVAIADDAARAYRLEAEDSPWRSACCLFEGVARQLTGDRERARLLLEEGARRGAVGAPTLETLCLAQLTLLAIDEDDLDAAEMLTGRSLAHVERFAIGDYPTEASVFAASALVRATAGRVEEATRDVRRGQRLLAMLTDFAPWYEAEVRIALARAALRLADVPAARTLLAEASRFLRQVPDAVVLWEWLDDARKRADAASSSGVGGGWTLTTAELRVLRFLPSHLSFPEIADLLYVSPNTVKTHARAVYRKLDVSSRAEAVAQAQEAGLLDPPSTP